MNPRCSCLFLGLTACLFNSDTWIHLKTYRVHISLVTKKKKNASSVPNKETKHCKLLQVFWFFFLMGCQGKVTDGYSTDAARCYFSQVYNAKQHLHYSKDNCDMASERCHI